MGGSDWIETDWLRKWAQYSPEAIALKDADSGREFTYRQFFHIADRLAVLLIERHGIEPGDRIALLAQNELECIFLFFAAQRARAILVPLNHRLAAREISHILQDCTPRLLVFQRQFSPLIEPLAAAGPSLAAGNALPFEGENGLCAVIESFTTVEDAGSGTPRLSMSGIGLEVACMILYTSGTTGSPKGAIITHGMLAWNAINTSLRLNIQQGDVTLTFLPLFHTGGWNVLTTPFLHRGARVVLLRKFDADRVLELCVSEKATVLFGVPTLMDRMRRSPLFDRANLSRVRYAIVGGEPMPLNLIRAWQAKGIPIRQGYGLTEFGPNVFSLNEEDSIRKIGSIGFPNFYIDARIVDEEGRELGDGQIGELILRGPTCTPGYWNNREASAQAIRDGWLHTGDLVRRDGEGYYYVVGRKKDMFISGAENVYPAEIEQYLRSHPEILEAAVIGVPDETWGEVGKAFIVTRSGRPLKTDQLIGFCHGGLARYKTPRHFAFLPELPKGESGKVLKRALQELPAP